MQCRATQGRRNFDRGRPSIVIETDVTRKHIGKHTFATATFVGESGLIQVVPLAIELNKNAPHEMFPAVITVVCQSDRITPTRTRLVDNRGIGLAQIRYRRHWTASVCRW